MRAINQPLEELVDSQGAIRVGWVGDAVLYARLDGSISAALGQRFATALTGLARQTTTILYYSDMSRVKTYDLLARSAVTQAVMANRTRFKELISLSWAGGVTPSARSIAEAVGVPVVFVESVGEFEVRLFGAAPLARSKIVAAGGARPARGSSRAR